MSSTAKFLAAAVAAVLLLVSASAQAAGSDLHAGETRPAEKAAEKKVTEEPGDACEICQAKRRFHEAAPWLKVGADLRLRFYYILNDKLDKHHPDHEMLWQRHRLRLWAAIEPIKDLTFNIRLIGEPRYWCKPDSKDPFTHCEAMFDKFNIKWKGAFGLPLTVTAGRQDFKFGEGWLLARDGTPKDGGRTTFFDAVRATWDARDIQTTLDLIYVHNHADTAWAMRPFHDQDLDLAEHDEQGAIVYVSNKSVRDHTIDGYFVYKHDKKVAGSGWGSDLYTFGARVKGALDDRWKYRAEIARQWGHKNETDVCALGANSELAYHVGDPWKNVFRTRYEYRNGHPDSQDGAFDILWGRWYQGSNLLHFYVAKLETLMAATSNYHRVALGWGFKPTRKLGIDFDYHLLFRDHNTFAGTAGFSRHGCFRGQLLTWLIQYDHNEHMKSHLMLDLFFPGDYYSNARNDVGLFMKYQIIFSW